MNEMCHKERAGNICSEQCQDTARRIIYMGKILGEVWAKKSWKFEGLLNRKAQNNCKKCLNKEIQEND